MGKSIRLSKHAAENAVHRGTTESEIEQAINSAAWTSAQAGRSECRHDFRFQSEWNGSFYETKQVRPIFVDEEQEIVVITVYVYYF